MTTDISKVTEDIRNLAIDKAVAAKKEQIWGWKVVLYLFLGGIGAGAWGLPLFLDLVFDGQYAQASTIGAWIGILSVGAGSMLLLLDLGVPFRFWRLVSNAGSMISLGTLVLISFLLLALIYISFGLALVPWHDMYAVRQVVSTLGIIAAFATAAYTGLLLGVIKARPFWNTPLLPVLWVISSLSGGVAAVTVTAAFLPVNTGAAQMELLRFVEVGFLITELVMIVFYLLVMHNSTQAATSSVHLLLRGRLSPHFWAGVIAFGIGLPIILYVVSPNGVVTPVAALLVLAGAFFLRYTFVFAGLRFLLPGEPIEAGYVKG